MGTDMSTGAHRGTYEGLLLRHTATSSNHHCTSSQSTRRVCKGALMLPALLRICEALLCRIKALQGIMGKVVLQLLTQT